MTYFLGVDVGTHSSKGVIIDRGGRVAATAVLEHATSHPRPGWAEHDADSIWWSDTCTIIARLLEISGIDPARVAAVGCSAIAPCVLPIDERGHPLRPAILYGIDSRATSQTHMLNEQLTDSWIRNETGSSLSSQAAGPKVRWIRDIEPEIWSKTQRVMSSTSYLVYRLTGNVTIDHYTAAAYGPMYSIRGRDWIERGFGPICDRSQLPDLGWSTEIAGTVSAVAAAQTGLAEGTPVVIGTADAAAEAVAGGVLDPGDTLLMLGSSAFFIRVCGQLPSSRTQWTSVFLDDSTYALAGGMSTAGALLAWFADAVMPRDTLTDAERDAGIRELAAEAAEVPAGAGGLLALPYLAGERTPVNDPDARGVLAGLNLSHRRGHLYRSLLEGVAYGIRQNLEAMGDAGLAPERLVVVGGGASDALMLQILSDVTGRELRVPTISGAALGDAMLAAVGVGALADLAATRDWAAPQERIIPSPASRDLYEATYELYGRLYASTVDIVHTLARSSS